MGDTSDQQYRRIRDAIVLSLEGHTDRQDERHILQLMQQAEPPLLDRLLQDLDLVRLVRCVDDRFFGPKHRAALFEMLTRRRLAELSVPARARLVRALQHGRTDSGDERAIGDLLLGTMGAELTALKNLVDTNSDHRDLEQLIYRDIDDDQLRAAILSHLRRQAAGVEVDEVKVLSDIDDTFYANRKDTRFPKKTVYPGVRQFFLELDRGPQQTGRLGDVTFVTARPRDRVGLVERFTQRALARRGMTGAAILTGSLRHVLTRRRMARKKMANFRHYAALYPEYGFVFIGDSGQGDVDFGQQIRRLDPERVRAVFIHDVAGISSAERATLAADGIVVFDSFVGAAHAGWERGLIHPAGLRRVLEAAQREMDTLRFESDEQRRARQEELARDVERCSAHLE